MQQLFASILAAAAILAAPALGQQTSNDDCGGAIPIGNGLTSGSTIGYTNSLQTGSCGSMGAEAWFSYVAPGPGTLTVSCCAAGGTASYDGCMAIFTGTCGSLTEIACNDDTCSLLPELVIPVTTGTTYYIAMGGYSGAVGTFTLSVRCTNCSIPAAETVRLGTPSNPNAFLPGVTSAPIIGEVWDPIVDHASFVPDSLADFLIVTANPANGNFGPPNGVLLCNPFEPFLKVVLAEPGQAFSFPIPDVPAFVGIELSTQGGSIDSGYQAIFANALDIRIGEI